MLDLLSPSTVSLSLEGWTLRLLETRGLKVLMWANIPLSPGLLRDGTISDVNGLGQVIGETFKTGRLSKRKVVCALNVPQAVSRMLNVPKATGAVLARIAEVEIARVLPAASQESFVYWQPVDGGSETQQVYVVAVPKEPLLAMVNTLKVAGIRPYSMDLRVLALARSLNQKDAILANLESNTADVAIVTNDIPVLVRSMYLGDEPVGMAEAQDRLVRELARTIDFYNDNNRSNPLPLTVPVYLTGDLASDPDLITPVESSTGHPVSPLEPPIECPPDFPSSQFMVNIGLALKEL